MKKVVLALVFALVSAVSSTPAAHADTVTLMIDNPVQSMRPGGILFYEATVAAANTNTGAVYLNADSFSLNAPFTLDDSSFLLTFPFVLDPGQSYTGTLFDIPVPLDSPIAVFTGLFQILGGATNGDETVLSSANFATAVTPEPSSLLLFETGLLCGAVIRCRARFAAVGVQ